jgi:hypothetical protein
MRGYADNVNLHAIHLHRKIEGTVASLLHNIANIRHGVDNVALVVDL